VEQRAEQRRDSLGNFSKFSRRRLPTAGYTWRPSPQVGRLRLLAAQVGVPSVVNMTQSNATVSLTKAGLVVGTVTNASSATVAAGSVISQTPAAAQRYRWQQRQSRCFVRPATTGQRTERNGRNPGSTTTAIKAAVSCSDRHHSVQHDRCARTVISQNPVCGSLVPVGSAVSLVVSPAIRRRHCRRQV